MATKKDIRKTVGEEIKRAIDLLSITSSTAPQTTHACDNMEIAESRVRARFLEAQEQHNSLSKLLANIEPIPIQITKAIQAAQSGNGDNGKQQTRKRTKHIPYKTALAILEKLNCPKDRKTLQRWIKGENTPDDFTPETMATVQAFAAWARIYANREQSKINTNNTLRIDNPNSRKMQKFR